MISSLPVVVTYEEIMRGILPVFLVSHAMYWFFALICPYVFPVYNTLDSGKQSYWAASMVSSVMPTYIAYKTMKIGWEDGKYLIIDHDHLWTDDRAVGVLLPSVWLFPL